MSEVPLYTGPPREHDRYTVFNDETPPPLEPFENGFDQPLGFNQFGFEFPSEEVRPGASWFRVSGFGFRASGFGFWVQGFGFGVWGLGFGVQGFGFRT